MKMKMKMLGAVVALLGLSAVSAQAGVGNPSYLNIDVTITNNLSVSVSGANKSTVTVAWTGQSTIVSAATAAVTNDSGYLSENWELTTTLRSWDSATGALNWTIAATPAADQVMLQAVMGASTIGNCTSGQFSNGVIAPALTSATQTPFTQTVLADTLIGGGGVAAKPDNSTSNRMTAGNSRALCWQLTMPYSTSYTGTQVIPIVVTAF
jgi:hypothetical protein